MVRREWMRALARGEADAIWAAIGPRPGYRRLRGPEAGLVMVRGRIGGGGGAFNLGEMTVSRCTVLTDAGLTGHAVVAGTDPALAEAAAVADALLADPAGQPAPLVRFIERLAATHAAGRRETEEKAAATRVDFSTLAGMRS